MQSETQIKLFHLCQKVKCCLLIFVEPKVYISRWQFFPKMLHHLCFLLCSYFQIGQLRRKFFFLPCYTGNLNQSNFLWEFRYIYWLEQNSFVIILLRDLYQYKSHSVYSGMLDILMTMKKYLSNVENLDTLPFRFLMRVLSLYPTS